MVNHAINGIGETTAGSPQHMDRSQTGSSIRAPGARSATRGCRPIRNRTALRRGRYRDRAAAATASTSDSTQPLVSSLIDTSSVAVLSDLPT